MLGFIALKGPPGEVLKDRMHISKVLHIGKVTDARKPDFGACEQKGAGPSSYPATQSDRRLYCSLMESLISKLASCKMSFYPWSL